MTRKNLIRVILVSATLVALAVALLPFQPTPVAAQGGGSGVVITQRTTADIMAEQARREAELAARPPRLKIERESGIEGRTQNPLSLAVSSYVDPSAPAPIPAASGAEMLAPQTVSTTFRGPNWTDSGSYPPDTYGDIGPTQYLVTINGRFRVYSKAGVMGALNADPDVFFSSIMTPIGSGITNNFTSDPRVRYDRLTQRWFIIIIDVPFVASGDTDDNRLLIAVSDGPTITGSTVWTYWYKRHDQIAPTGNTDQFADYPTLGLDKNALYVGMNMFSNSSGFFTEAVAYSIPKAALVSGVGGEFVGTAYRAINDVFTPQGVMNDDANATNGYFVGVDSNVYGRLVMYRISNPGTASPTITGPLFINVPSTSNACQVDHSGTGVTLDTIGDRLFMAMKQGGSIWTAHNIQVNSSGVAQTTCTGGRVGSRWYELRDLDSTPTLFQSGTVFDSATTNPKAHWIPSIAASGQGHVAMGFSISSPVQFVDAGTTGRLSGDTLGTMRSPAVSYQPGEIAYNPPYSRWGDYSYTSVDPCDNMTFWTIQEYVQNVSGTGRWAVSVAKLLAPLPADLAAGSLATVNSGQSSVNVNLTGAATNGRGFYDPGSSYLCRLAASVTNGVTVNSVTYNSPTSITLNLNTTSATPGLATVTITNPDGQVETGQITIQASTPSPIAPTGVYSGSLSPTYTVSEVPGATLYAILTYDLSTNTQVHYAAYVPNCAAGFCNFVQSGTPLTNNKVYGWYAIAYVNNVWGNWSSGQAFLLSVPPTGKPTITEPIGQYNDTDAYPTLKWTQVDGAFAYYILMYDLSTNTLVYDKFYDSVTCAAGICSATPNAPANALQNGKVYGWYVIGGNYGGFGPWSDGAAFLIYYPPAVPTQISTTFTSPGSSTRPNYNWNAVQGATGYYVLVQTSGGTQVLLQYVDAATVCSGSTCTYTHPSSLANNTYGWFVLASNPAGVSSAYSAGLGFTIPGAGAPAATFVPPANSR